MLNVEKYVKSVVKFYEPFSQIKTIYLCGAVEREDSNDQKLQILWHLYNVCLSHYIKEHSKINDVDLVFIPLVSAEQTWSKKCSTSDYKVHRSKEGYKQIYKCIYDFLKKQ